MSQLKKKISLHGKSAADILKKLHGLTGLIYLNDNNNPIIGFLPQKYILFQDESYLEFHHQNFNEYRNISKLNHLIDFTQFKENNSQGNIKSTTSFTGGYIGFISYDFSAHQFIDIRNHIQPSLFLGQYRSFLKYIDNDWYFFSDESDALELFSYIENRIENSISNHSKNIFELKTTIQPRWSKKQYFDAFNKIQEYIKAGDCYQINLTQEFKADFKGSLLNKAADLWNLTNAPYAGYLKLDNFELLSCSPELFIEFNQNKQIKTRPIKGTMPRYKNVEKDFISKQTLKNSQKDQAENVMIVDLLRNDLSIYANTGSVKTTKLFEIESFNQVHHMVSEIVATLKDDVNPMEMLLSDH